MRILLVEDEIKISNALSHLLRKKKIEVDVCNDGDEGFLLAQNNIYDVIVLDIMLPGMNGLEILSGIRDKGINTPVLLLTARDSVEDRVVGLESGADDYLIKPFATTELIARINALGRRVNLSIASNELKFGNMVLDTSIYELRIEDNTTILSSKEGKLLELLMKRPGQVFSKEQILLRIWGFNTVINENNVEIYVHHLRKKLEGSNVEIETIRGIGYTLKGN